MSPTSKTAITHPIHKTKKSHVSRRRRNSFNPLINQNNETQRRRIASISHLHQRFRRIRPPPPNHRTRRSVPVHHQRFHARERASSKDESKQPETDFRIVQRRAHFLHAPDTAGDVSQSDDAFVNHDATTGRVGVSRLFGRREVWISFHFNS